MPTTTKILDPMTFAVRFLTSNHNTTPHATQFHYHWTTPRFPEPTSQWSLYNIIEAMLEALSNINTVVAPLNLACSSFCD